MYAREGPPAGRLLKGLMNRLKKLIPKLEYVRRCRHAVCECYS